MPLQNAQIEVVYQGYFVVSLALKITIYIIMGC